MKLISTISLLLIASICFAQACPPAESVKEHNKISALNVTPVSQAPKKPQPFIRRCYSTIPDNHPLLFIDGRRASWKEIIVVNPDEIEKVHFLPDSEAEALFGTEGTFGVIYLTIKSSKGRKLVIMDFVTGSPIPGATVFFTSTGSRDTMVFAANDSGVISTNKLSRSKEYNVLTSAVGFTTLNSKFKNGYFQKEDTILLSREVKYCKEVVVASTRRLRGCRAQGIRCVKVKDREISSIISDSSHFKVFPTVLKAGGTVTFLINNADEKKNTIRIASANGSLVKTLLIPASQEKTPLQVETDPRWSAGIYFIQLLYENGRIGASERIIIQ